MGVQNCLEKAWRAVNIMAAVWDVKRRESIVFKARSGEYLSVTAIVNLPAMHN